MMGRRFFFFLATMLLLAASSLLQAQEPDLKVKLEALRSSVFPYQAVPLKISFENQGAHPLPPLSRKHLLGDHNFLCALASPVPGKTAGHWMILVGRPRTGTLGALQPGESFVVRVSLKLPPHLVESGGQLNLQWLGDLPGLPDLRSNELLLTVRPGSHPVATVETDEGSFTMELWQKKAPNHVASFIRLSQRGFFDGLFFHRIFPNYIIQTGSPGGTPHGGPGYTIAAEFNDAPFKKGTAALATVGDDRDSGGSQWFICLADLKALQGRYTAFAKVLEGQEVVDRIGRTPTNGKGKPRKKVRIRRLWVDLPASYSLPEVKKGGSSQAKSHQPKSASGSSTRPSKKK